MFLQLLKGFKKNLFCLVHSLYLSLYNILSPYLMHAKIWPVSQFYCLVSHLLLQASLGGRVRLMITGAAPVSPTILTFLRAALGCQVSHMHTSLVVDSFCVHAHHQ